MVHYIERPDMSRNLALAGKTVSSKGVNVTYDEDGYAVCLTNYKHKSFVGTMKGIKAPSIDAVLAAGNRGGYAGSPEDLAHFSDSELASIEDLRRQVRNGESTAAEAYYYLEGLRRTYGYAGDGTNEFIALEPQNPGVNYAADTASQVARVMMAQSNGTADAAYENTYGSAEPQSVAQQAGSAADAPQVIVQSAPAVDAAPQTIVQGIPPQESLGATVAASSEDVSQIHASAQSADSAPRVITQSAPETVAAQTIVQEAADLSQPQTVVQTNVSGAPASRAAKPGTETKTPAELKAEIAGKKADNRALLQKQYQERLRLQQDMSSLRFDLNAQQPDLTGAAYNEQINAGLLGLVMDPDDE